MRALDDPTNGGVLMLLGQTFFALGQYNDAAGSTELAMKMLPPDKWNAVVSNYQQLYGKASISYRPELEKARNEHTDDPGVRLLLGFHYYYLGFAKQSLVELDKTLQLEPKDPIARQLHNIVAAKLGLPASPAPPGTQDYQWWSCARRCRSRKSSLRTCPASRSASTPRPADRAAGQSLAVGPAFHDRAGIHVNKAPSNGCDMRRRILGNLRYFR